MAPSQQLSGTFRVLCILLGLVLVQGFSLPETGLAVSTTRDFCLPPPPPVQLMPSPMASALTTMANLPEQLQEACILAADRPIRSYRIVSVSTQPSFKRRPALTWPVIGEISSGYGYRRHPFTKRRSFHNGIDIKARPGTPVTSPVGGIVLFRRRAGANGNLVKIRATNGTILHFGHLRSFSCKVGQKVAAGQVIGAIGSTGRATGPHLHFVVQKQGRYLNPLQYLGRQ